jgi:hypothetical protein
VQAVVAGAPVQLPTVVAAGTQLGNTPLLLEPRTQSLLAKVANGKRMPSRLHSREQLLDAMQVSVEVLLEWEILPTPILGPPEAGDLRFSWLLELTTSLVLAVAAAAGTTLLAAQVVDQMA